MGGNLERERSSQARVSEKGLEMVALWRFGMIIR
jgi:hypothetical protein